MRESYVVPVGQFVDGHAQQGPVHSGHPIGCPSLCVPADDAVQLVQRGGDAFHKGHRVVGRNDRLSGQHLKNVGSPGLGGIQDLEGRLAGLPAGAHRVVGPGHGGVVRPG